MLIVLGTVLNARIETTNGAEQREYGRAVLLASDGCDTAIITGPAEWARDLIDQTGKPVTIPVAARADRQGGVRLTLDRQRWQAEKNAEKGANR